MKKARIGQSTIEYVIMFAIVVGAIILLTKVFSKKVQGAYSHLSGEMQKAVK
jgi:hypothetical protein